MIRENDAWRNNDLLRLTQCSKKGINVEEALKVAEVISSTVWKNVKFTLNQNFVKSSP